MAEPALRYVTTGQAASYFGVCAKTFRRMVNALPARRRPKQKQWPGTSARRWDLKELEAAFDSAHASSDWDADLMGGGYGATPAKRNRRVGRQHGRA